MTFKLFQRPDAKTRKRLWLAYHIGFVLLLAHFLMVHFLPGYSHAVGSDWRTAFSSPARPPGPEVIERDDGLFLWAGDDPDEHFDITEFRLNPDQLRYGLGREAFPALIEPEFDSMSTADQWLEDDHRVLVLRLGDEVRVYPIDLLIRHEIVNDVVNDIPVFAAYCILADLGAVYDRRIGGRTFTFGLSGHTYSDPEVWDGMQVFVFWDRETESLWWPAIGKAVSGLMIDTPLPLVDEKHWSQTNWGEVKSTYEEATILQRGQDMERPTDWPKLTQEDLEWDSEKDIARIAPRWGVNAEVSD